MAVRAPMATWRPFTGKTQRSLAHDIVCCHTMVGTLAGSWSWANQTGNPYWHFGLGGDGTLWQCVDLDFRSAANLEGNDRVIPIETEDKGPLFPTWSGSDVPAWTPAQINRLVELITWLCKRFEIPPVLIPDTKPGRRGLAYHRQGIDPWRVDGGELWSKATGKQCPGDRRINQFRITVIPRVQAAMTGEDDMPLDAADKKWIYDQLIVVRNEVKAGDASIKATILATDETVDEIADAVVAKIPGGTTDPLIVKQAVKDALREGTAEPAAPNA